MRLMFAITVPATVGFLVMGEPIIAFLFEWGAFRAADTALTLPLLWTFALGLPLYSMTVLLVRGFYAFKDTQTPMKISIFVFVLNLVLSLVLMQFLGVVGLALANVLAILGQTVLLTGMLSSRLKVNLVRDLTIDLLKIAIASVVMVLAILGCRPLVEILPLTSKGEVAVLVLMIIPIVVVIYFVALWLIRFSEMEQLRQLFQRLVRRNSSGA